MSLAAWAAPFLTTDQNGSDAWPCVTTARWMLLRALLPDERVAVGPAPQAARNAARPGTAARPAPAAADVLMRPRRVNPSISPSVLPGSRRAPEERHAAPNVPHGAVAGLGLARQHRVLLQR